MAEQDDTHPSEVARVGPRPRLPTPTWMRAWPRGVAPVGLSANLRGVEFLYRAPDERWFRVEASLRPERRTGIQVRALPGTDPAITERLAKAVELQLARSPLARPWLRGVSELVDRLSALRRFGGAGSDAKELELVDRLLASVATLRERETSPDAEANARAALDASLAELDADPHRLDAGIIAELGVIALLAAGAFDSALERWHRHAADIETRDTPSALACAALMRGYLGEIARAQGLAQRLAGATKLAIDARHAGELLAQLGRPELATAALREAACDTVIDDGSSFAVHFRLAQVAAAAHDFDTVRWAAAAMRARSDHPDKLLETARMQREAGEFEASDLTLEELLREQPDHRGARSMLADSKLWRREHEAAAALVQPLVDRNPQDVAALRTLGACELLAGRHDAALELLGRALEVDARDYQARLWLAEAYDRLGRHDDAAVEVQRVGIGDYPIWQLLRALIEEHQTPRRRIQHDTWFIVDTNIRQIVGDEAPADTGASHEVACAAISAALERLGGNRTKRLTTPTADGSLRWLSTVESPRQRAETLQLQACHRSADEVVEAFAELTRRYPAVPFFHTYPAELLMWRGEHARAHEMFQTIWEATRTRWGYVGSGAAAMFLGQDERALEVWEEGKDYYTYIDAEATYCYRGELLRKRGQLDAARPDLELAVEARPGRVGAWVNLALLHHAVGDEAGLREAVRRVEALVPAYAWEARREVGLTGPGDRAPRGSPAAGPGADPDALARYMDTLLTWMRGNRSSVMHTIMPEGEQLRVVPAVGQGPWRDHGRRSLALFEDQLLSSLAREL